MKLRVKRQIGIATSEVLIILGFFLIMIYFSAPVIINFFERPVQQEKKDVSTKDISTGLENKAQGETRKSLSSSEKSPYDMRF